MNDSIDELIVVLGVVGALAVAYSKAFGGYQAELTQALIDAFAIKSRFRRLANLGVGIGLAVAFTVVGALWLGSWAIVPAGALAGILSSVEAGRVHDEQATQAAVSVPPRTSITPRPDPRRPVS